MKENQRIALTKRLLKESLIRLMKNKNIQNISISELCKDAGINRTTFYNHYYTPYGVLKEIEENMIDDMQNILKDKTEQNDWTFKARVEVICNYLKSNSETAKLLFKNNSTESEFTNRLFQIPKEYLGNYKYFSDDYDQTSQFLITSFLKSGIYNLVQSWLLNDVDKTPKEMGELIYALASKGWLKDKKGR